ncbi:putative membrane protein insertion efficiency factor [Clostridia bacterium]|nr:putative membrane protein insertion efficiency factor [Clostridia bacterium]
MKRIILWAIKLYINLGKFRTVRRCRFYPSCSVYAHQAIEHFGVLKGLCMGLWRIMRCNPFSKGGYDPVLGKKP